MLYVGEGTVQLTQLSDGFQSLPPLPTSKFGPSGADSQVGGFVYILGPCEARSFSHLHNPHRFLQPEILRLYFLALQPWIVWSVLLPICSSQLFAHTCGTSLSTSHCLTHPGPPADALLPCLRVLFTLAAHLCPSYQSG